MPRSRKRDLPVRVLAMLAMAGTVLALCSWTRPAFAAAAPFCDERGATVLAPPPALPSANDAISRPRTSPCRDSAIAAAAATLVAAPAQGHPAPDVLLDSMDAAALTGAIRLPDPAAVTVVLAPRDDTPTAGVRSRVERPPRG